MVKTIKKTETTVKKVAKIASGDKAPIYNLQAEKVGDLTLSKSVFGVEINNDLIAQNISVALGNKRSAHAKVKDRGEVNGTTKKMYAQKGTGRARHSTSKVGIFVGGGSVHGPQGNQTFIRKINKTAKRNALHSLLSKFAKSSRIIIIDDFAALKPKTKEAWNFFEKLEATNQDLEKSKKIGIITLEDNQNVIRAFGNIPGLNLFSAAALNVLDLSNQNFLVFSQKAVESLK